MRPSFNGSGAAATLVALLSLPLVMAAPLLVTHAGASAPAAAASPSAPFDAAVARRIEIAEVQRRVAGGEKVVFLDTRGSVQDSMIKGAAHVPDDELATWAKDVKPGTLIVTYCA